MLTPANERSNLTPSLHSQISEDATGDRFHLYFDKDLIRSTPYHIRGDYVRKARDRMDRTFDLLKSEVPGSRVLDIGASPFYLLYRALAHGASSADGVYFTNDEHPLKGVGTVYSGCGAINIHHSDIENENLPFADDSFDVVTACEVLEHLDRFPGRLLSEMRRVLRPGGYLCITVPNVASVANIIRLIFHKNIYMRYRADTAGRHKHEYTMSQLKALYEFLGIDIVKAGVFPSPTSDKRWLRPAYRAIACMPGLRAYSPAIYVLGRQPTPKSSVDLKKPPASLYDDAFSIEE
ncbi:methyltransferase domain-containing protein [Bradyrhizobium sp. 40]|uniref:class I SAM-dependent methyltransferase n=1 Tax=Bradyrhizobium sp. 40 TaxID=2782674 RepID=UPI001FFF733F|nr:class I SAM-dependent methyltransferase [Bradyrhizobium sp. 40]UPJ41133.1 methyltransferase domain-containing protein [Bradyrhizobium sp. 40]